METRRQGDAESREPRTRSQDLACANAHPKLFATPVAYPNSLLLEPWRSLYGQNPMAGVVEGFRWALLGRGSAPGPMLAVSILVTLILLVSGAFYFRRMEKTFADIV